jgi:DNA end-binding protein Ku
MRAVWTGTISFGLVNIPVALGVATKRSDPKFRTLDARTLQPVRRRWVAPEPVEPPAAAPRDLPEPAPELELADPGPEQDRPSPQEPPPARSAPPLPASWAPRERTVEPESTVKGFEISPGRFVVVSPEELEALNAERRRSIDITAFVDVGDIDPIYYDRSYLVAPREQGARAYALLVEAMKTTGKAAVGRFVLSRREHLALLRPSGDSLVVELLFYPEDVRTRDKHAIEDEVAQAEIDERELAVAAQLVESMARPFDPDEFENERKRELLELVERKAAGDEVTEPAPEPSVAGAVPDLMAALEASLAEAKGKAKKRKPAKPRAASRSAGPSRRARA